MKCRTISSKCKIFFIYYLRLNMVMLYYLPFLVNFFAYTKVDKLRQQSQDGRKIGQGDNFIPYKLIKRSFECWATSTKQLLNADRGHQAPRKTAQFLWKEVWQNIKDKNRNKRFRDADLSRGRSREEDVSTQHKTLSQTCLWGALDPPRETNLGGKKPQNMHLTATDSRDMAQTRHICQQQVGGGQGGAGFIVDPYGKDQLWVTWRQSAGANMT